MRRILFGSSLVALVDQAVVSGTNFAAGAIVGRWCGATELGVYALAFSVLVLAMNVHASLVTSPFTFFSHHLMGVRRRALCGSALVQHAALTVVSVLALAGLAIVASLSDCSTEAVWAMLAVLLAAPCVLLRELGRRMAYAELNSATALTIDLLSSLVQLGGMFYLARQGQLNAAMAINLIGTGSLLVGLVWLIRSRKAFAVRWRFVRRDTECHWTFGKWVLVDQMFAVTSAYAAQWLLYWFFDATQAGVFAACWTIAQLANPVIFGLGNVLEPRMAAAMASGGSAKMQAAVQGITKRLVWLMAAFAITFALLGDLAVKRIYRGEAFDHDPLVIPLLALAMFASGVGVPILHGLRVARQSQANFVAGAVAFAITMLVGLWGVPLYGILAGAAAMLAGNIAGLLIRWLAFQWAVATSCVSSAEVSS